jgi:hypothetical protein
MEWAMHRRRGMTGNVFLLFALLFSFASAPAGAEESPPPANRTGATRVGNVPAPDAKERGRGPTSYPGAIDANKVPVPEAPFQLQRETTRTGATSSAASPAIRP